MPRHPQREHGETMTFAVTFAPSVELLPAQRQAFASWLGTVGVGAEDGSDLTLVFSELTANAVAGSPEDAPPVAVEARVDGSAIVLEVRNGTDPGEHPVQRWDLDDPLREGGRGLVIVRALVDDLDVVQDGTDLRVRCRCDVLDEERAAG